MNWELIGKLGGTDIQVHPVEVVFPEHGVLTDREILKVRGEPGSQYLITIVGHYENSQNLDDHQLRWRTERSDWVQTSRFSRGGQTQVAVPAQDGDTLTVGRSGGNEYNTASFIGKAYIIPVPEISEEQGSTTSFPIGPMTVAGSRNTEHSVADLDIPPGEVWRVKVTGTYTWDGFISNTRYPSVMIGSMQSKPVSSSNAVEVEAYASTVSRISLVTNDSSEVTFEGTVEITPMKW